MNTKEVHLIFLEAFHQLIRPGKPQYSADFCHLEFQTKILAVLRFPWFY